MIRSWPVQTIPDELINKILEFYKNQKPYDKHFSGKDLRGKVPQMFELPELYTFLLSIGYKFDEQKVHGNYLDTQLHYPIHTDSIEENGTIILIPLYVPDNSYSYLFILDQKYEGEATTFCKQPWKTGSNTMLREYDESNVINYNKNAWDQRINDLGIQLTEDTLQGMSLDTMYRWKVGSMISWPTNQLHFAIADPGENKIGLSIRIVLK